MRFLDFVKFVKKLGLASIYASFGFLLISAGRSRAGAERDFDGFGVRKGCPAPPTLVDQGRN